MLAQTDFAAQTTFFSTVAPDARADRGRREIDLSAERVTIRRRLRGIDMRLSLEVSTYKGVALCLRPAEDGRLSYQVRLVHRDSDLSVLLDEAADDTDILADWRLWARVLGRPALVEREIGQFELASATPEAVEKSGALARRARPLKRRPRFLARRKAGRWPVEPTSHASEREIIART